MFLILSPLGDSSNISSFQQEYILENVFSNYFVARIWLTKFLSIIRSPMCLRKKNNFLFKKL